MSPVSKPDPPLVKPDLFRWARETAGLAVEEAARRIAVAPGRLEMWEAGDNLPTVPQLRKIAAVYHRPVAALFLPAPPPSAPPSHDFRHLPDHEALPYSPELRFELRHARRRRSVTLELLAELGLEPAPISISARLDHDPEEVARRARNWLGLNKGDDDTGLTEYEALKSWTNALEERDVLVFQTAHVELAEMRGFSLTEKVLPVIVLNGKDAVLGRVFTVAHELAHVLLGTGGVCTPERVGEKGRTPDERVEIFCNHFAGALLVPADELLLDERVLSAEPHTTWTDPTIGRLAGRLGVSRDVLLRRLLILGKTSSSFYEKKRAEYLRQYREREKRRKQETKQSVVPWSRLAVRDNGRRFTRVVLRALENERITPADVSDYLGIGLRHLEKVAAAVEA